jgi:hypothetical protein
MHQRSVIHLDNAFEPHLIIGLPFGKINDAKATFSETVDLCETRADGVLA